MRALFQCFVVCFLQQLLGSRVVVAQDTCATVDAYDQTATPGSCEHILASGLFTCNSNLSDTGVVLHMVCLRSCGKDLYDSQMGDGSCAVVATAEACPTVFAEGGRYAGYCDFACGFCDPPVRTVVLDTAPPIDACPEIVDQLETGSHGPVRTCLWVCRRVCLALPG